jgi:hypothetical protein
MLLSLVNGAMTLAAPGATGTCPSCSSDVVAKCGSKVVWHWAHRSLEDCDTWSEGETSWHAAWKSRFERTEVLIRRDGVTHRADAVGDCGTVIEFQHSGISWDEIIERENFYGGMCWVLDGTRAFQDSRIGLQFVSPSGAGLEYVKFRWKARKRSFDGCRKPIFIDLGFAYHDYGKWFYKSADWWDDEDGGLRDGIRRRGGRFWQRTLHGLFLLEIKKQHDSGYGWGRLVSHGDFCKRFGGMAFHEFRSFKGLRTFYGGDGYYYEDDLMHSNSEIAVSGGYRWCEEQVARTREVQEAV